LIVDCFIDVLETMETAMEIVKGISHRRRAKGVSRRKKEEEEGKVAEKEGGGARQAGKQASRRSPFIARLANLEEGRCQ